MQSILKISSPKNTEIQSLKINMKKGRITGTFQLFKFKEGDNTIWYMPSLGLSGYGDSAQEAQDMLMDAVNDYFTTLYKSEPDTVADDLKQHGWIRNRYKKKQFNNNTYVDKNGILKNFELPEDTIVEESIAEMA